MIRRAVSAFSILTAVAAITASAGFVAPIDAQDRPLTDTDRRLAALFGGMGPTHPVRVATPTYFVEATGVAGVADDHVELAQDGERVDVDFIEIRNVAVRDSHWLQGALWGGGAGILVGGVAGLMIASFDCKNPAGCTDAERDGMITWAAVLGGAGLIGGFVIGRHSFYWQPIFP
jgi:hypothetical protein